MKNAAICLLMLLLGPVSSWCQDKPQYAVSLIPDSMKNNVNSVVRESSSVMVMKKPGKGKLVIKKVVTVLNDKAEDELVFHEYYDKFHKIDDIEINIYDEKGKYVKRSRKKDLHTQSAMTSSLLEDDKVIYAVLSTDKYPITIETNYEVIFEGVLEYPDFYPQTPEQSIMLNTYTITTPDDNKVRYKNYRCNVSPKVKAEAGTTTLTWEVRNVMPFEKEPGSAKEDIPRIQISPTLFEMDDYPGNMTNWETYGKWVISLNKGINKLPEQSQGFYRNLVKDAKSDREKVAILYKYLQENFRYVSIQLGIGGFKPFSAEFVEKKKYGDCKGLSNYMYAMLDAVNVRSHYTVINAEYNSMPVSADFAQHSFNHIVLCVPLSKEKDTVWLECTDRTQPFNSLGTFTENRYGVLITETGGVLVPTPRSKAENNVMHTTTIVELNENGSGKASVDIKHTGEFTRMTDYILDAEDQEKKSYLINDIGYKQPDEMVIAKKNAVTNLDYLLHYDMSFEKIPDFSAGSKHFLNARIYKFWNRALPKSENRQSDFYLRFPMIQSDSTIYQLPEGYGVDNLPKESTITSSIGKFQAAYSYNAEKRQVITTCRIKVDSHVIPASRYQEAVTFFSNIISEQQQKIVVKKL